MDGCDVWWNAHDSDHRIGLEHSTQVGLEIHPRGHAHGSGHPLCRHVVGVHLGFVFGAVALDGFGSGVGVWFVFVECPLLGGWPCDESPCHRHHARRSCWNLAGFQRQTLARCWSGRTVCGIAPQCQPRPDDVLLAVHAGGGRLGGVDSCSAEGDLGNGGKGDRIVDGGGLVGSDSADWTAVAHRAIRGLYHPWGCGSPI